MKISIAKQGAPVVDSAMTVISSDDVEVIELDMTTKYCEVVASSGQTVYIACRETALHCAHCGGHIEAAYGED